MMRFWFLLNVLFLVLITPAEVHICQAGLVESAMHARICAGEQTLETDILAAAQAVGIYSAALPFLPLLMIGVIVLFCWQQELGQRPALAVAVPTPPPRLPSS